jgi:ABC-type amino acid transport substrate-binding protein
MFLTKLFMGENIMKKLTRGLLSLSVGLLLVGCSNAQVSGDLNNIVETGKLIIGTNAEYPPFEFVDVNGQLAGLDIELGKLLAQELSSKYNKSIEVEFVDMPFDGLIGSLQANQIDMIAAAFSKNAEREEVVLFSNVYYQAKTVLLVKNTTNINTLEQLAPLKLGAQLGTIQEGFASDLISNQNNLKALASLTTLVLDLKNNNIDAVLVEEPVANSIIKNNSDLKVINTLSFADDDGYAFASKQSASELIAFINETISKWKSSGKIEELLAKVVSDNR